MYRTRAIKGRADYSKIIFWEFSAASNQERLQFKKYFLDLPLGPNIFLKSLFGSTSIQYSYVYTLNVLQGLKIKAQISNKMNCL